MTRFVMAGADQEVLLHHMAFYGLGDILEEADVDVLLTWEDGRPVLLGEGLEPDVIENAVRAHVEGRREWVAQTNDDGRGTMSPRLTAFTADEQWQSHQTGREEILDRLAAQHRWGDLRYLAALGEPSYWSVNRRNEVLQDDGASRFEMQPRNRGSEFVGNRLRPLAEKLLVRKPGQIVAGLDGSAASDELGGKPDSVSATGMTTPGPVDSALVWCALWGIGWFPLAHRVSGTAVTSGHLGRSRREWFYVPVWRGRWRPARARSILASAQLRDAASTGLTDEHDPLGGRAASTWLRARGVAGVLRFPIGRFGSDNAPERRALRAEAIPL
ncbi:hypothetical protein GCM10009676_15010 [Prauserella halophila]|uniref:CRISPR-associated protein Csb3 n=1 Tax=Prauserella halophila TaxID=185641 RepID=A0ABN1W4X3_9PSEU|nr:hypothetical protein [Prauserella halophila]MCP2236291.1 CRISPR-associated protein Csb3 [Prauserella halophila]